MCLNVLLFTNCVAGGADGGMIHYSRKGFELTVINEAPDLEGEVLGQLVETFFTVYPVLVRAYNDQAVKEVEFFIDPTYEGVAEAGGHRVRINPAWLQKHPDDFDLVTHEVMHLVQAYPNASGPWWVTEGIADYVRYVYGCDNVLGGWSLTPFADEQHYTNGYRITARFFTWIEHQKAPGFVKYLDHAMREGVYTDKIWKEAVGKNIDDLWREYAANPSF